MKVIIMRGIPGSGKSTITNTFKDSVVCSADQHFTDEQGNYNFDPKKLNEAHKACMQKFLRQIDQVIRNTHDKTIIIDNTNIELWEISPYIAICQAYDVDYEIITVRCDPEIASKRNMHGVPAKTIQRMCERLEGVKLLPWWNNRVINQ